MQFQGCQLIVTTTLAVEPPYVAVMVTVFPADPGLLVVTKFP